MAVDLKMLEEAIEEAVEKKLRLDVSGVLIQRDTDADDNDVVIITIRFVENPARMKRGFMFDLVSTAARALREAGESTPAVVFTRSQKPSVSRAH